MNHQTILLILACFAIGCSPSVEFEDTHLDSSAKKNTGPTPSQTEPTTSVAELLPIGETSAMLLEYLVPPEITQLAEKMAASIASHPDWVQRYTRSQAHVPPGEPLPYHENFGISADEYNLLNDTLKRTTLTPSVPCTLNVELDDSGLYAISVHGEDFTMSGLMIDSKAMSASFGSLTASQWVESESPAGAPFRVDGIRWKTELPNPSLEQIETLFVRIGNNLGNGKGVLMYRVLHVINGNILAQGELNIEWERR